MLANGIRGRSLARYERVQWSAPIKEQIANNYGTPVSIPNDVEAQAERLRQEAPLALVQEFLRRHIDVSLELYIGDTLRAQDDPAAVLLEHEQRIEWNHGLTQLVERTAIVRFVDYYVKRLRDMGYVGMGDRSVACPTLVIDHLSVFSTRDLHATGTIAPLRDVPVWAVNRPASQTAEEARLFKWRNDQHLSRLQTMNPQQGPARVPGVIMAAALRVVPQRGTPGMLSDVTLHHIIEGAAGADEDDEEEDMDDLDRERHKEKEDARKELQREHEKLLEAERLELKAKREYMQDVLANAQDVLDPDELARFLSVWAYYEYVRDVAEGRLALLNAFEAGLFDNMGVKMYREHLRTLAEQHAQMEELFRERRIRLDEEMPLHKRRELVAQRVVDTAVNDDELSDDEEGNYKLALHAVWYELNDAILRERDSAVDVRDRMDEERLEGMIEALDKIAIFLRMDPHMVFGEFANDESRKRQEEDIRHSDSLDELAHIERDMHAAHQDWRDAVRASSNELARAIEQQIIEQRWPASVSERILEKTQSLYAYVNDMLLRSETFLDRLVQERRAQLTLRAPKPTVEVEATVHVVPPTVPPVVEFHDFRPETVPDEDVVPEDVVPEDIPDAESASESETEPEPVVRQRMPLPDELERDAEAYTDVHFYADRLRAAIVQNDRGTSAKSKKARVNASFSQIINQVRNPYARPVWTDIIKPMLVASNDVGRALRANVGETLQSIIERDIGVRTDHFKRDGQLSDAIVSSLLISLPPGSTVFSALKSYVTPAAIKQLTLVNRMQRLRQTVVSRLSVRSGALLQPPSEDAQIAYLSAVLDMNDAANEATQDLVEHVARDVVPPLVGSVQDPDIDAVLRRLDTYQPTPTLREAIAYKDVWNEQPDADEPGDLYHKRLFAVDRVRLSQKRTRTQKESGALLTADEKRVLTSYFDEHAALRQDDVTFAVPGLTASVLQDERMRWQHMSQLLQDELDEESMGYTALLENAKDQMRVLQATTVASRTKDAVDELVQRVSRASNVLYAHIYKYALVVASSSIANQLLRAELDASDVERDPFRFYTVWQDVSTVDRPEHHSKHVKDRCARAVELNSDMIDAVLSVVAQPAQSLNDRNVLLLEALGFASELEQEFARVD